MDKRNEGSWDLRSMQWSWQTREVRRHRSDGRTSAVYWRNKTFLFSTNPFFYDFAFNAGNDRSITTASTLRYIQKSFISSQNGLDLIGRTFCSPATWWTRRKSVPFWTRNGWPNQGSKASENSGKWEAKESEISGRMLTGNTGRSKNKTRKSRMIIRPMA